jgi:hypothetical protein
VTIRAYLDFLVFFFVFAAWALEIRAARSLDMPLSFNASYVSGFLIDGPGDFPVGIVPTSDPLIDLPDLFRRETVRRSGAARESRFAPTDPAGATRHGRREHAQTDLNDPFDRLLT